MFSYKLVVKFSQEIKIKVLFGDTFLAFHEELSLKFEINKYCKGGDMRK